MQPGAGEDQVIGPVCSWQSREGGRSAPAAHHCPGDRLCATLVVLTKLHMRKLELKYLYDSDDRNSTYFESKHTIKIGDAAEPVDGF